MLAKRPGTPRVLFVHHSAVLSGCEAYRMWLPRNQMAARGYTVDYLHFQDVMRQARRALMAGTAGPGGYDIYVLPRGGMSGASLGMLGQAGKRLVFEVDDDFTNEHREVIKDPAEYERIWYFARREADAITVSTPYLARLMRERTNPQVPIYILPNSVHLDMWQGLARAERLTLGLTGSITHGADWAVLADVLPRILAEFPQVGLNVAGFVPDWVVGLRAACPERVATDTAWHDYREYPAIVGKAHIVLCPVEPTNPFNWSKSGIKAIEGLAAGAAVVASDINIYRPVIGDNRRGLLADFRPESWYEAIRTLIIDPSLRHRLASRGREWVAKTHDIARNWGRWWEAYQEIASR